MSGAVRFRLHAVDRSTWEDGPEIAMVLSSEANKEADTELIEDLTVEADSEIPRGYVRLYMESDDPEIGRTALITALVEKRPRTSGHGRVTWKAEGTSVLKPAQDRPLEPSWRLPCGRDPVFAASMLLAESCAAPVNGAASGLRVDHTVACEKDETYLSMATYLLDGTGYGIEIDCEGRISIAQPDEGVAAVLDESKDTVVIGGEMNLDDDAEDAPNSVMVVKGSRYAVAKNEDDGSELSIQNLGWERGIREDVDMLNGYTLEGYAAMRLQELSIARREVPYSRAWNRSIRLKSKVELRFDSHDIRGGFEVAAQRLRTGKGLVVEEVARERGQVWRR